MTLSITAREKTHLMTYHARITAREIIDVVTLQICLKHLAQSS